MVYVKHEIKHSYSSNHKFTDFIQTQKTYHFAEYLHFTSYKQIHTPKNLTFLRHFVLTVDSCYYM